MKRAYFALLFALCAVGAFLRGPTYHTLQNPDLGKELPAVFEKLPSGFDAPAFKNDPRFRILVLFTKETGRDSVPSDLFALLAALEPKKPAKEPEHLATRNELAEAFIQAVVEREEARAKVKELEKRLAELTAKPN